MIDRAKTIEMAREAGFQPEPDGWLWVFNADELARFAALVRDQVIEECIVAVESAILRLVDPRQTASACLDAIRSMKSDPGHSVSSVAEVSTAPLAEGAGATASAEPVWCGCGDGIMPETGAKCWICAANDAAEIEDLRAENAELQRALTMSGKLTRKLAEEALAHGREWPAGLIDRVKAAAKRIDDNRAPRSIPADPHSDVDLVLAEVRCFLEGSALPFWVPGAPRCRSADNVSPGSNAPVLDVPESAGAAERGER